MSLKPAYFEYLKHFEQTVTVQALAANPTRPDLIALRHDIDYDLDLALEMGYWEKELGICSTYYLLHTADYWQAPRLVEKCLQLQDFGHEVGLHLNLLTEWVVGEVDDIALRLAQLIAPLRTAGVNLVGVSAHGDRQCYEQGFINYWCFQELRPAHPTTESGLSAEGIPVSDPRFQIQYPGAHQLTREDGTCFPLWSISMRSHGLRYDAIHVPCDRYFTDSGGGWHRSTDPLHCSLHTGRHQVLIHPLYWRGSQKQYFFLSTARSGSKWLTQFLDQATPLMARHEFTLNHTWQGETWVADKRTGAGFTQLAEDLDTVNTRLLDTREWLTQQPPDFADANVYLAQFPKLLQDVFPDATLVHLHRNPSDVVRSILNRDWYDTPEDHRHPPLDVKDWSLLSQFEKACWYARLTHERLLRLCDVRLSFERMTQDLAYLMNFLKMLKIPVYPRLADQAFSQIVNANYSDKFPAYVAWDAQQKHLFHKICDPINISLGYATAPDKTALFKGLKQSWLELQIWGARWWAKGVRSLPTQKRVNRIRFSRKPEGLKPVGCSCQPSNQGVFVQFEPDRNAYVLFQGGGWYRVEEPDGWAINPVRYYRGRLTVTIDVPGVAQLFCLMYGKTGELIEKRSLGQLSTGIEELEFAFRPKSEAKRLNLAIYRSASNQLSMLILKQLYLDSFNV